jgi:5'-3' exonuclease
MADRKERFALLSRYSKLHNARYEARPQINLNVEQWAADALIESYGIQGCYDLLQYYFDVAPSPNWKYFAHYAQDIIDRKEQYNQDLLERQQRRQLAKKWLSE